MAISAAERQAAYRKRLKEKGLLPVTVFVPAIYVGEITSIANKLAEDRDLELGPLRNAATGKLVSKNA